MRRAAGWAVRHILGRGDHAGDVCALVLDGPAPDQGFDDVSLDNSGLWCPTELRRSVIHPPLSVAAPEIPEWS